MPPRMWRSDLFTSRIFRASAARPGFTCTRRDVRSLCTVLCSPRIFSPSAVLSLSSRSCKSLFLQHALRYSPSQKPPKTLFYSVFGGYDRYVFYFIYNTPIPLSSVPAPDRYPRFFGIFSAVWVVDFQSAILQSGKNDKMTVAGKLPRVPSGQ